MGTDSSAQQSKRRGFSLVEAAIVLAVVGLVIGGIWVASAAIYERYRVNKTVEGVLTAAKNIQKLISVRDATQKAADDGAACGGGGSYLNSFLIPANILPKDWVSGSSIKNPFGGVVGSKNYCTLFSLQLWGLNQSQCIDVLVNLSLKISMTMRTGDTTGGRLIQVNYPDWYTSTFPIDPEQAKTACHNSINNYMYIYFTFTRTN